MVCPHCGAEIGSEARFCAYCGTALSQEQSAPRLPVSTPNPRKKPKRLWLLSLLLIPLLGILLTLTGGRKLPAYALPRTTWQGFVKEYPLTTVYVRDDTLVSGGIGKDLHPWLTSQDGSVAILHTLDGEVHMLRGEALTYIARDIESVLLSRDGSSLGCIGTDGTLQLIHTQSLEKRFIAKNVLGASISPDGKNLAYHCREADGSIAARLYTGRESIFLAKDRIPFALSNGGKEIYCLETAGEGLYLLDNRGERIKIVPNLSLDQAVCLNADHSQLLFHAGSSSYLWNGGESRIPVGMSEAFSTLDSVNHSKTIRVENGVSMITLGIGSFTGRFYSDRDTLLYLDGNSVTHIVAREIPRNGWQLTSDGKTLFYRTKDGKLMRVTAAKPDISTEVTRDVTEFAITPDGKALYVLDSRDTLWYLKEKDMPKLVAEGAGKPAVTHDGVCLYLTKERDLAFSLAGSPGQVILPNVYSVYTTPTVTYIGTDYNAETNLYSVYATATGTDFRLLLDAGA